MKISDKFLFSDPSDLKTLERVLEEKKLSGTADIIGEYEAKLANFFGHDYAVALSSGTAALQAALFALGVEVGDQVIISSTCPIMSVVPILYIGAEPVFCDTSDDNFGLDLEALVKLINPKVKAVIEVPMWGYPTRIKELRVFLKEKNIGFIADLAQAHATKYEGEYMSRYSDIACFSTHDRKILATGEGGFVLTDNKELEKKMRDFIQFGNMNGKDFGLNYKLGAMQAAIGLNRIDYIKGILDKRKSNAQYITSNIKNDKVRAFSILDNSEPNYYAMLIKLSFGNNNDFIKYLDDSKIPSEVLRYDYKVLYQYPMFEKYRRSCRQSEILVSTISTLPVHQGLDKNELDYIIDKINSYGK